MNPPSSPELRKDAIFLACLLLVPIVAFVIPRLSRTSNGGCPGTLARAGAARALLEQLESATKAYELDWAAFPPGDGSGTAGLIRCLAHHRNPRGGYFDIPREDLTPEGDLPNPVDPDKIVYYRQPGLRRPKSFDLWCGGADGRPDGINNWDE